MKISYQTSYAGHMRRRFNTILRILEIDGRECTYYAKSEAEWEEPDKPRFLEVRGQLSADLVQNVLKKYDGLKLPFGCQPSLGENITSLIFEDGYGVRAEISGVAWSEMFESDMLKEIIDLFKRVAIIYPMPYGLGEPPAENIMDFLDLD